jgi:hypothetical protein
MYLRKIPIMKISENASIIPKNFEGKSVDLDETVMEKNAEDAENTFNRACTRLLNPAIWHELAGALSAEFELQSPAAENPGRLAKLNDYIKINIPGPGNSAGDGYDWVMVEAIEENTLPDAESSFAIRLRSSRNPAHLEKGTAHFFNENATSTFIVKKEGNIVMASYHGRNEVPNIDGQITDKIRNTVVASGAALGLSELHWKALLKGLLTKEIGG